MSNNYYVYMYIDPRNNLPFYIGKGTGQRKLVHLNESGRTTINYRKYKKIKEILKDNLKPIIKIYKNNLSETAAFRLEIKLIKKYGREKIDAGGILANYSAGGQGGAIRNGMKHSKETKRKLSKIAKEQFKNGRINPMTGKNRSGSNNPMYGRHHSKKTKRKISIHHKGHSWNKGIKKSRTGVEKGRLTRSYNWTIKTKDGRFYKLKLLKDFCSKYNINYNTALWCSATNRWHKGFFFMHD